MFNNMLVMLIFFLERGSFGCDNCDSGDFFVNRCVICFYFLCEICIMGYKRGRSIKSYYLMNLEEVVEEGFMVVYIVSFYICSEELVSGV